MALLANQSIGAGAWTEVLWTKETYDSDAYHDQVNTARLTVPQMLGGWYHVAAQFSWECQGGDAENRFVSIGVWRGGVLATEAVSDLPMAGAAAGDKRVQVSKMVYLAPSDYVTTNVVQTQATARYVASGPGTWLQMHRVGT